VARRRRDRRRRAQDPADGRLGDRDGPPHRRRHAEPDEPVECGGRAATAGLLAATFSAPIDADGDRVVDRKGGTGVLVDVQTDRSGDLRDAFGRLLAYLDAADDLPPIANGQTYDVGRVQILAGNSPASRFEGRDFARLESYRSAEEAARGASRGVWGACGGAFHAEP